MKKDTKISRIDDTVSHFPEWYWKSGLHDAVVLSVKELELTADWQSKKPRFNCLEICIDSKGALFDKDIKRILLYNFKAESLADIINSTESKWWMGDELTELTDGSYKLEITLADFKNRKRNLTVIFKEAEIER